MHADVRYWPKADIGSPQCAEDIRQCLQSQDVDRRPRYASGALPLIVLIGVKLQKSEGAPRMYAKKNLCEATHIRFARPSAIIWVRHSHRRPTWQLARSRKRPKPKIL